MYAWISLASGDITTCLMKPPCFRICLLKCPDESTKNVSSAYGCKWCNCDVVSLTKIKQYRFSWFHQTGWSEADRNEMIWNDMKWHEVTWNDIRWCEMASNDIKLYEWYEMKRKDIKGYEKTLTEPNICKAHFTRVHQNDRRPCLDVAATSTCKNKEYLRSFLICLWSGMAKRFKWSFWYVMVHDVPQDLLKGQHLALRSAVKLVTGLDEWTSSRSKICSKSLWPSSKCRKPCQYKKQITWWLFFPSCRADVWASYAPNLGKAHQSFFCLAVEHGEFHFQYQFFKSYLIY